MNRAGWMIEYRHLRHFVEVADLLHVTEAAKRLHIAQPALSQSIRTLEQDLNVKLFLRKNKRMALTDAGRAFLAEARKSVDQFEYAKAIARSAERGVAGKLSIGFGPTAALGILPATLRKFRSHYPDVELVLRELGTEGQLQGVERRELDVAIGYTQANEPKFSARVLRTEELVVLLPRGHPLAAQRALALRQIAGEPLILPRRSAAASVADAITALYSSQNLTPRFAHQVETPQAAHALVAAGLGVSLTTSSALLLSNPLVERRSLRDKHAPVELVVFWCKGDASPVLTNFLAQVPFPSSRKRHANAG